MKSLAAGVLAILLFALTVSPLSKQKAVPVKPDFSGEWLLDLARTNVAQSGANLPIKIVHRDPELRIVRTYEDHGQTKSFDYVYYTDGRGEKNLNTTVLVTKQDIRSARAPMNEQKTITTWNGLKIMTRSKLNTTIAGRRLSFNVADEWALSTDGNVLTEITKTTVDQLQSSGVFIPARNPDIKRVYVRQP
ncbi:MAG TPA: hypothetical protein VJT50_03210 [Pyrinomonadaceae bacterium]|nr:hypothetical protein [Pyrinomonadaceae bacterium]